MSITDALWNAAEQNDLNRIKRLLASGIDINVGNNYSLQIAASYGHLNMIKYLINRGADIHAFSECALRFAIMSGHLETVKYLVSQGANVKVKFEEDMDALAWAKEYEHKKIIEFLSNYSPPID